MDYLRALRTRVAWTCVLTMLMSWHPYWALPPLVSSNTANGQLLAQQAVLGGAITLTCPLPSISSAQAEPFRSVWQHNGFRVTNHSRARHDAIGDNLLIIKPVQRHDGGLYECLLPATGSIVAAVSLEVIWITSATVRRDATTGQHAATSPHHHGHQPITLTCHVDASPSAATLIEWHRNGQHINTSATAVASRRLQIVGDRLAFNQPTTAADDGVYSCSARHPAGTVVSKHNFTMTNGHGSKHGKKHQPPQHHDVHGSVNRLKRGGQGAKGVAALLQVDENGAAVLECELPSGARNGALNAKWMKDGKVLRQVDVDGGIAVEEFSGSSSDNVMPREDYRIVASPRNGSLLLSSAVPSDAGLYECLVYKNSEPITPTASNKIDLTVIEKLKFAPQPASKNLELGSTAKIHCKVQGTPTPLVAWTRHGAPLARDSSSVLDVNGTLVFRNVSQSDKGNYSCEANNTQGSIVAAISVDVVQAPRFVVAPAGPIQALEGESVLIHCQATGDPMPTIQWDKDLQYLNNEPTEAAATALAENAVNETTQQVSTEKRYHVLANGTLHILEVHYEDEGRYGCTIGSSVGLKREEVQLSVRANDDLVADEPGDGFMITRAVLITMSVAFAYIVLVVGLMIWCRVRRQARKARLHLLDKDATENGGTGAHDEMKMDEVQPCLSDKANKAKTNGVKKHRGDTSATHESNNDTAASTNSKVSKKSSNFDSITLSRTKLVDLVSIGKGEFGDVLVGRIDERDLRKDIDQETKNELLPADTKGLKTSLNDINVLKENGVGGGGEEVKTKDVLVKALNKVKDEAVGIEFRRQIEMFRTVSHKHVSKLYGLCRDKDPHYLVLEYTDRGVLKEYLTAASKTPLSKALLLRMAWQIGRGMDAIYRARYIHKDLAARNCLINSNLDVKVSYPALHTDKYGSEYFKVNNAMVPLRWTAPECLHDDDFSTKSDVFAYGVLLWELFADATDEVRLPMADLSNEEYLRQLKDGSLSLKLAAAIPADLTTVLTSCWNTNPKERPSFHTLHTAVANALQLVESALDAKAAAVSA